MWVKRMNTIQIKNRYTQEVIFEFTCENNTIKRTVEEAVKRGIALYEADLPGADLKNAKLNHAQLVGANLCGADLSNSQLIEASLVESILVHTDLTRANLDSANLTYARITNIILYDTNLNNAKF